MNPKLLVFRELLKRFSNDDENKVLTHALGLSALVYFSTNFIRKTLENLNYSYRILENQGMLCLIVETDKEVYISFRGTRPSMWSNWKKLLNFIPKYFMYDLRAHGGFALYHKDYQDFVKEHIDSINNTKDIIFTGHSMGAAIASLYNISYTKSSKCICFASPNLLYDSPFNSDSSKSYQIKNDFVTWIPPSLPLFKWSIPTKAIKIKSKFSGWNPIKYHALDNYIASILDLT